MKAEIIEQKPQFEGNLLFINNDKTVVIIGKKYDNGKKIEGPLFFQRSMNLKLGIIM